MQFAIRHFMPGRVRLWIPTLCYDKGLAEETLAWLRGQSAVRGARINYACSSLVVEYEIAFEPMFRLLIGRLRLMTLSDLRELTQLAPPLGDSGQHLAKELIAAAKPAEEPHRYPLLLPTVSMALAFVANPVATAINIPLMLWNGYPIAARAYRVLRDEHRLNVDFLDTLAILASLAQGNHVAGGADHLADKARRLDQGSHGGRVQARDRRSARIRVEDRLDHTRRQRDFRPRARSVGRR